MFEQFYYVNHKWIGGDHSPENKVVFGTDGIFANASDLRDYEWSYTSYLNSLGSFKKETVTKEIPCVFIGESRDDVENIREKAFECFELDVLYENPGRIYINDYYINCYIIQTKNDKYMDNRRINTTFKIVCFDPKWRKSKIVPFNKSTENDISRSNYPKNYSMNYTSDNIMRTIDTDTFNAADFILTIHGPCTNPSVTIGDYSYTVNCDVLSGERLEINSIEKTVVVYSAYDEETNQFHNRDRTNYIFQPIEPGENLIQWDRSCEMTIELIESRSEPKWT